MRDQRVDAGQVHGEIETLQRKWSTFRTEVTTNRRLIDVAIEYYKTVEEVGLSIYFLLCLWFKTHILHTRDICEFGLHNNMCNDNVSVVHIKFNKLIKEQLSLCSKFDADW